jgi:hypothetical protein
LPTANAGADASTNEGTPVTLSGSGTGVNLTYTWTVPAGITDFSDIHAQNPTVYGATGFSRWPGIHIYTCRYRASWWWSAG